MLADSLKLYKLIVLYFLYRSGTKVTNAQLSGFILEYGYTDYISVQETLEILVEDQMIIENQTHAVTYYTLTESGMQTIEYFKKKLPEDTIRQIHKYLKENRMQMVENTTVWTDIIRADLGGYQSICRLLEQEEVLLEVALNVPSKQMAETVCGQFRKKADVVYSLLLKNLTREEKAEQKKEEND